MHTQSGVRDLHLVLGVRGACKNDYLEIEGTGEKAFDAMTLREIEAMCRCWGKFDDGHTCPYELHGEFSDMMRHVCSELKLIKDVPQIVSKKPLWGKTYKVVRATLARWDVVSRPLAYYTAPISDARSHCSGTA